jgi:hypothetical protein
MRRKGEERGFVGNEDCRVSPKILTIAKTEKGGIKRRKVKKKTRRGRVLLTAKLVV